MLFFLLQLSFYDLSLEVSSLLPESTETAQSGCFKSLMLETESVR